jgi:hypothetical protein
MDLPADLLDAVGFFAIGSFAFDLVAVAMGIILNLTGELGNNNIVY